MNRHYFNLEQDKEQPRWSWDHFASWGIDLLTFGELNFQSFANLGPRTPRSDDAFFFSNKIENRSRIAIISI